MTHLDDLIIATYSADPSAVADRRAVEQHLRECSECSAAVELYASFDRALRHADTWSHAESLRTPPARIEELQRLRHDMAREEAEARRLLDPLLSSPIRFRHADLEKHRRNWTAGMVRVLCAASHARHEKQPRFSGQLATVAYNIGLKLPNTIGASKRSLLGLAMRERANALRYLGKFADALRALDTAAKFFDGMPNSDPFDRAVIDYIRAIVYMETDHLEDAIQAARMAAATFRTYGETRRELAADMAAASSLMFAGRFREAADAYQTSIALARAEDDSRTRASAVQNAALVHIELGRLEEAEAGLAEALVLYDEIDCPTEKARTTWALGSVSIARGQLAEGIAQLTAARGELSRLGLTNDAALATLEWAEARFATGRSEGVADACRGIVLTFASEGMQRKAQQALATVNEALALGTATPRLLRHLRSYLQGLPAHPDLPFRLQ